MKVGGYARVSTTEQAQGEARSIEQQLAEIEALCKRMGWTLVETFIDCENYRATQAPNKGKVVNPSGERADRPEFLKMLERLKTGELDAVACWRDDRLVRHPRVAVALEDALDLGDARRNGVGKIQVYDATGGQIDRFTLSIKATIWREENKRRAERTKMGKIATLQEGRWPGAYERLGYTTISEPGKRGRRIVLADPEEVQTVKDIFEWCDQGLRSRQIRARLLADGRETKSNQEAQVRDWSLPYLSQLLRARDYTGITTWNFLDGSEMEIEIPQIIDPELFERVQERVARNKVLSTRNAKGVYLLQGLAVCGECEGALSVKKRSFRSWPLVDGTVRKRYLDIPEHQYRCNKGAMYPEEGHPTPYYWNGADLDWTVWRNLVDKGISQPELLTLQIMARQEELQRQGENVNGEIAHARRRLSEVDDERAFYQRQAARGTMTEREFDARMAETQESAQYWQSEIKRLTELRDDTDKVEAGLTYIESLLGNLQARLPGIDLEPEALAALPKERRRSILEERRTIVRALCQKVIVWSNGDVKVIGVLDGSESAQLGVVTSSSPRIGT